MMAQSYLPARELILSFLNRYTQQSADACNVDCFLPGMTNAAFIFSRSASQED